MDIFEQIKDLVIDLESDANTRGSAEWPLFEERYEENLQQLKDLVDQL